MFPPKRNSAQRPVTHRLWGHPPELAEVPGMRALLEAPESRRLPIQVGTHLLEQAMAQLNFSARAHDRILKVARTLADLDEREHIGSSQILEAIQYRSLDRNVML